MWVGCVCTNTNIHKPTHLQTQTQGVTLPDAIANAILDTQSIKEQINAASNAKDTAAVNAQTSVYNAELDAAVTLYTAEPTWATTATLAKMVGACVIASLVRSFLLSDEAHSTH